MRGRFGGLFGPGLLLGLLLGSGCGGDEGGGGGDDPIVLPDAAVDMAPMEEADPYRDFCRARAEAICGWGYDCFGATGALTTFGLSGPTLEDCVEAQHTRCYTDLRDRADRGTVDFSADGGAVCAMRLQDAPCLATPPGQWVGQWQMYVQQWCGNVARGLVPSGGACRVQADCGDFAQSCIDGACAEIPLASLIQTCDPGPELGLAVPDESCPTGTCVNVQTGGICSAPCEGARTCGPIAACLQAQTLGGAIRPFCALRCAREDDPTCGDLDCNLINEDQPDGGRVCEP